MNDGGGGESGLAALLDESFLFFEKSKIQVGAKAGKINNKKKSKPHLRIKQNAGLTLHERKKKKKNRKKGSSY